MKLYLNVVTQERLNSKDQLLKFYDKILLHSNFSKIDKSNFKEIKKRYHNHHNTQINKSACILEKCFISIDASFFKKQKMIDSLLAITSSEIVILMRIMTFAILIKKDEAATM